MVEMRSCEAYLNPVTVSLISTVTSDYQSHWVYRNWHTLLLAYLLVSLLVEKSMEQLGVLMDKDLHCCPEQCQSSRS